MAKATARQFLVNVEGIRGTWRGMEGGHVSAEYTPDYSGGAATPDLLSGPPQHEDITVTRTYDPVIDEAWAKNWKKQVGIRRVRLTKQPLDGNLRKVGKPTTWPGCLLIGLNFPDVDANSADAAEISLTFATTGSA